MATYTAMTCCCWGITMWCGSERKHLQITRDTYHYRGKHLDLEDTVRVMFEYKDWPETHIYLLDCLRRRGVVSFKLRRGGNEFQIEPRLLRIVQPGLCVYSISVTWTRFCTLVKLHSEAGFAWGRQRSRGGRVVVVVEGGVGYYRSPTSTQMEIIYVSTRLAHILLLQSRRVQMANIYLMQALSCKDLLSFNNVSLFNRLNN